MLLAKGGLIGSLCVEFGQSMKTAPVFLMLLALPMAACAKSRVARHAAVPADWKAMVTPSDMDRIRNWRTAFVKAVEDARKRGSGAAVAAEGKLLDPDAALGGGAPPPGKYSCRVIKLGGKQMAALVAYPVAACSLTSEGDVIGFARIGGVQRPVGLIFPGDGPRQIFLGTMTLGDERRALEYGRDATRDMAGAVERIGPNRWRLILPYPRMESMMDVIELIPVS
jgi:hypothetical protein